MKLFLLAAFGVTTMLAGCDSAVEKISADLAGKPVTIVMAPGYEIANNGKAAKVFGTEICPDEEPAMTILAGPARYTDSQGCLVITPTTRTLNARVVIDGQLTDERWSVERSGKLATLVYLKRPDGSPVISYSDFLKSERTFKNM